VLRAPPGRPAWEAALDEAGDDEELPGAPGSAAPATLRLVRRRWEALMIPALPLAGDFGDLELPRLELGGPGLPG